MSEVKKDSNPVPEMADLNVTREESEEESDDEPVLTREPSSTHEIADIVTQLDRLSLADLEEVMEKVNVTIRIRKREIREREKEERAAAKAAAGDGKKPVQYCACAKILRGRFQSWVCARPARRRWRWALSRSIER